MSNSVPAPTPMQPPQITRKYLRVRSHQRGSSMLEVLMAILIFFFGLLALVGAQANAVRAQGDTQSRSVAAFLANQVVGDLWSVNFTNLADCAGRYKANSGASDPCNAEQWGQRLAEALPNGELIIEVDNAQVNLTITWQFPGSEEVRSYEHVAHISRN
jgi:type IV pilus assembly protein PilV